MYQKMRSLHLAVALFSLAFLLAYGLSAVEFAHRKWWPRRETWTDESLKLPSGITDARVLASNWRGELTGVQPSPGLLRFQVSTPLGRAFDVTYSIATGDTKVRAMTVNFLVTLAFVHTSHGVWAFIAGLTSVGLLILGATGLYLWFKNHSERWIGGAILAAGLAVTIGLIVSMRNG